MKNFILFTALFFSFILPFESALAQGDQPPQFISDMSNSGDTWISLTGSFTSTSGLPITVSVSYEPEGQPTVQDTLYEIAALNCNIVIDGLEPDNYYTPHVVFSNQYGQQTYNPGGFLTESVGVAEVKQAELKLFPNPMASELFIENAEMDDLVTISDMIGKQVRSEKIHDNKQQRISVGELTAGIYFVTVGDKTTRVQKK